MTNILQRLIWGGLFLAGASLFQGTVQPTLLAEEPASVFHQKLLVDEPALYWSMTSEEKKPLISTGTAGEFPATVVGSVKIGQAGPRPQEYPEFDKTNQAVQFSGGKQRLVIQDVGEQSPLKFRNGDAITIEAWVRPQSPLGSTYPYIIGKGRTYNKGFNSNNQNYALRLTSSKEGAALSFFFVDEEVLQKGSTETNGHRWTSQKSLPLDGSWHHVAFCYEFGKPETVVGYIDGKPTSGQWDMAGATTKAPIVDDDEVWIGSSMNGSNTFAGQLDEIAIHRRILPAETLAKRYKHNSINHIQMLVEQTLKNAVDSQVTVDLYEGISSSRDWKFRPTEKLTVYETDVFALTELPKKYNSRGIIIDRKAPYLVHSYAKVTLPAGEQELVLRAFNGARLYVDGKMLLETPFMGLGSSAHGTMHKLQPPVNGELLMPIAHTEKRMSFVSDGKPHVFSLMTIAGHRNLPPILGELVVAAGQPGKMFFLGPEQKWEFTDEGWLDFTEKERQHRQEWNAEQRRLASAAEAEYWQKRHAQSREWIAKQAAVSVPQADENHQHPIDRFIARELAEQKISATEVVDDWTFLRRITLDIIGTNPTEEQIAAYFADPEEQRREYVVERLLNDENWADHWIPYWQDVLAENPGLTKPMLNNSGPFRWYLHEAFQDNRSFDRIVTELILMEGSRHDGGTAGFAIASENDVPMAAKAHILGTAFLGVEMKCARCHDAPYHSSLQKDLFEMAAMLERKPISVPKSSSINVEPEKLAAMIVKVTLKPGEAVAPAWPFAELLEKTVLDQSGLVRDPQNTREVLAAMITHPQNERFTQVIVNRVWKRLIGQGIVEPVQDWETGEPTHPELLAWLSQEFVKQNYDLKALTRLIVTSQLYQQEALSGQYDAQKYFAGPSRRRLTAEQLVDSIYQAVGKELPAEQLTYNSDGRQQQHYFIDFGRPQKAWEMVAISNERERPSMNLPHAQSVADLLAAYGWRSERQDPITDRELNPTPLQPMAMANGIALNGAVDISEHSQMIDLCLEAKTPEEVVNRFFLRTVSRYPTAEEQAEFLRFVEPGFADRKTPDQKVPSRKVFRSPLTWTAHFDPDARDEGIRQQEAAEAGDVPTKRLKTDWRHGAEDAMWVLLNSPEFIFVP